MWEDVRIDDVKAAEVRFEYQVDRQGRRQPLKTAESRRTVEIPPALAVMIVGHKLRSAATLPQAFVFAARSGRALQQRDVGVALRRAQKRAINPNGQPTFPVLHRVDEQDRPLAVPPGMLPSFHSFRHGAASEAIAAGESAEEVSWQLGHKNSLITRQVYVQQIKGVERSARRRAQLEQRYGELLRTASTYPDTQPPREKR